LTPWLAHPIPAFGGGKPYPSFVGLGKNRARQGVAMWASHGYEIERKREGEAEVVLASLFSGAHAWRCRGLEEEGMSGKFIVTP
jgi:hypothetical protein